MSKQAEKLQEAIGLIKDEYVEEAHGGQTELTDTSAEKQESAKVEDTPAKTIKMPEKRRAKRAAAPIAIAACLVFALGVGALAFTSLNKPAADDVAEKDAYSERVGGETELASPMTSDAEAGDMAVSGAKESATGNLVPGIPMPGQIEGEAFVLTAGEWNDNNNWAFFTNLVNSGAINFPVFGLEPTNRVKVTVVDGSGNRVRGQEVSLLDGAGNELWRGVSDKDGAAYLFYRDGQTPGAVSADGTVEYLAVEVADSDSQQGTSVVRQIDDVTLTVSSSSAKAAGLQVMFIVDTTGSMSDEIAYLQKDFTAIAADAGTDGIEYSVNFYRDKGDDYVTKCNGFTSNITEIQALLNAEYADGGGDAPEAVAEVLTETITNNAAWRADCNKVAFLIFDAPPHDGTDAVIEAAVSSAAEQGIRLVPVVASNADRETELFGRALAIMTDATYVFLTDDSGVGDSHLEPIIGEYSVELLHDVIVRIINDNR